MRSNFKKRTTAIIMLIIFILSLSISGCIETGKGMSKDAVYGIENNGIIWKTWSVWLLNDHPTADYSAIYSVSGGNEDLVKQLQQATLTNRTMVIEYKNYLFVFPWEYSSTTVITNISAAR